MKWLDNSPAEFELKEIFYIKAAHQFFLPNLFSLDSYSSEDVQLKWLDNSPVEMNDDELSLPQFELKNTKERKCKDTFKTGIDYLGVVHIIKRENAKPLVI